MDQLRQELTERGKDPTGPRNELIKRWLQPEGREFVFVYSLFDLLCAMMLSYKPLKKKKRNFTY